MEHEDEFIADSEEELMDTGLDGGFRSWDSEISAFAKDRGHERMQDPEPNNVSSISEFTAQPNTAALDTISTFTTPSVKPPRPRPRPIPPKKKAAEPAPTESSGISSFSFLDRLPAPASANQPAMEGISFDLPMSSIADRAKTRQRKPPALYAAVQWEDEEDFIPAATGNQPKLSSAKGKGKAKESNDVIELTDEEDELNIQQKEPSSSKSKPKPLSPQPDLQPVSEPAEKPRPKPRPRPRKPKAAANDDKLSDIRSTPAIPPPDTDMVSSQVGRNVPPHPFFPSSLPPSDPPLPTSQPNADFFELPRIETLPQANSDPHGPGDLPSSNPQTRRSEIDQLFSEDEELWGPPPPPPVDPKALPPPPTFFAGSSSLMPQDDRIQPSAPPQREIFDLTTFPTQLPARNAETTQTKPKRKKKVVDPDDEDEDWGAPSSKAKEKKKPAKKREKAAKKGVESVGQVEVVITSKPPTSMATEPLPHQPPASSGKGDKDKGKSKKKAKGKDGSGSSKKAEEAKDVFKSKETIEDSDEDPLLEPLRPSETSTVVNTSSEKDIFQEPRYEGGELLEPLSPLPEDMVDDVPRKEPARKKRKTLVVDDDEDFDETSRVQETPSKRRKKAKDAGKDSKTSSDKAVEEKESSPQPSKKKKGKAKATLVVSDEEEVEDVSKPGAAGGSEKDEDQAVLKVSSLPTRSPSIQLTGGKQENVEPVRQDNRDQTPKPPSSINASTPKPQGGSQMHKRNSLAFRARSTPMSELIKRVNSLPNSPFPPASSSRVPTIAKTATAYSPYLKSSRSLLSKIAPLHPNRRTPPPPPPPPPPKKKTKKELEREERWEEEMIESVGGIETWAAMSDMERKDMRRAKMDMEMGGWD
ncbi:hypothetical protein H1R20_g12317, partial [Candolleomyces eurysporus]